MRDLQARMLAALLAGEGLRGVAELAAGEAGSPVAIVIPARGLAAGSSQDLELDELVDFAARLAKGESPPQPAGLAAEAPVIAGERTIGFVLGLESTSNGSPLVAVDLDEVLRTAALAALTEVAVADARDEVAGEVRGSLLEDLRAGRSDPDDSVRRAARLGGDLSRGAIVLVAEVRSSHPHHAAALISSEYKGAIAEPLPVETTGGDEDGRTRIYALLPARGDEDAPEQTAAAARALSARLRAHGPAAFSSFCAGPADLHRAVAEAELMLEVIAADDRMADQLADGISNGVYRLLFRAMATDPDEVHRFYSDTVEPLVSHDRQYHTDLLSTLESYLANDCNMNATARAVYAHRHTVAHRLGRIKELTSLDPALGEDRERLGLGIKAYRILAPTLPR
jgi:sugar diacid utilization regulator